MGTSKGFHQGRISAEASNFDDGQLFLGPTGPLYSDY